MNTTFIKLVLRCGTIQKKYVVFLRSNVGTSGTYFKYAISICCVYYA